MFYCVLTPQQLQKLFKDRVGVGAADALAEFLCPDDLLGCRSVTKVSTLLSLQVWFSVLGSPEPWGT